MNYLKSLAVFARVAELGSFAAASRDMGLSPAMIGNHIRALEQWFSTTLLRRTTRQQSLTEAGNDVLVQAQNILAGMAALELIAEPKEELSGYVRVSAPIGIGRHFVAPVLRQLAQDHKHLQIELRLSDVPENLVKSGLDLAVRNGPLSGSESSLIARVIARQSLKLVASPAYLSVAGRPSALIDMQNHRTIRYARDGRPRGWLFQVEGGLTQIDPPTSFMADDIESLCDAACNGLGIAYLPDWLVNPHLAKGLLELTLPDITCLEVDTYLVRPASQHASRRVLHVAGVLASRIRQLVQL
jgi:DNA-binding transcriptional LysR family regulator